MSFMDKLRKRCAPQKHVDVPPNADIIYVQWVRIFNGGVVVDSWTSCEIALKTWAFGIHPSDVLVKPDGTFVKTSTAEVIYEWHGVRRTGTEDEWKDKFGRGSMPAWAQEIVDGQKSA